MHVGTGRWSSWPHARARRSLPVQRDLAPEPVAAWVLGTGLPQSAGKLTGARAVSYVATKRTAREATRSESVSNVELLNRARIPRRLRWGQPVQGPCEKQRGPLPHYIGGPSSQSADGAALPDTGPPLDGSQRTGELHEVVRAYAAHAVYIGLGCRPVEPAKGPLIGPHEPRRVADLLAGLEADEDLIARVDYERERTHNASWTRSTVQTVEDLERRARRHVREGVTERLVLGGI